MKTVKFVCRNCGCRFTKEVLEPGEAQDKKIIPIPLRCPNCGNASVSRD